MPHLQRRTVLGGLLASGAFAMTAGTAPAAGRRLFFQRIGLPIGLQTYTLGDDAGKDIDAMFAQVAAIGYREVELPNLYAHKPAQVRAAADKAGVAISSLHIPPVMRGAAGGLSLGSPAAELAETLGTLGAKIGAVPLAPFPENFRPRAGEDMKAMIGRVFQEAGADHWRHVAAALNEKGAALKAVGIGLGYHNHNMEFAPIAQPGGATTTGWDILVRETDPAAVHFEADIGWVVTAGLDPLAFLRRHRGRIRQLHVKDVAEGNTVNFALNMKPAEVGFGTLDWAKILPAAHAAGVRHFYVEQEPPFAIPRIESARKSYGFLSQLKA